MGSPIILRANSVGSEESFRTTRGPYRFRLTTSLYSRWCVLARIIGEAIDVSQREGTIFRIAHLSKLKVVTDAYMPSDESRGLF
jgi:hypothetical protein